MMPKAHTHLIAGIVGEHYRSPDSRGHIEVAADGERLAGATWAGFAGVEAVILTVKLPVLSVRLTSFDAKKRYPPVEGAVMLLATPTSVKPDGKSEMALGLGVDENPATRAPYAWFAT